MGRQRLVRATAVLILQSDLISNDLLPTDGRPADQKTQGERKEGLEKDGLRSNNTVRDLSPPIVPFPFYVRFSSLFLVFILLSC